MATIHTIPGPALRASAAARARRTAAHERRPAIKSTSRSRARLSLTILLYCAAVVAVFAFAPFQFALPSRVHLSLAPNFIDLATAAFLFVPLGFLYPLTKRGEDTPTTHVLMVGAAAGAAIQLIHAFQRDRIGAPLEIVAYALGAVAGAMMLEAMNRRIRLNTRLAGRLSLETPLMGLTYMLVPLLTAASLAAIDDPGHLLALLPLGLFGARLIAAVQEFRFAPAGVFRNKTISLIAAGWLAIGVFPIVLQYPLIGISLAVGVGLSTWYFAARPAIHGLERRFEVGVLRDAAPYLAIYLAGIVISPFAAGIGDFHIAFGLTGSDGDLGRQMIRLIEPVGALTIVGYALAEVRGRRELPFASVAPRLGVECAAIALVMEVCRAWQPNVGASIVQFVVTAVAGIVGARIYHDQRERVRWILIRRKAATMTVTAHVAARVVA